MPPEPHRKCSKLANKDEILRMYDRTMMQYVNFLAHLADINKISSARSTISKERHYLGKTEVLRNILGFNGNMEDE